MPVKTIPWLNDDTGRELADRVNASRGPGSPNLKAAYGPGWWRDFVGNREAQSPEAAEKAIQNKLTEVSDWTDRSGVGFRTTLMRAAFTLGGYVAGGWLDEAEAQEKLEAACSDAWGAPDDDDLRWIAQGLADGGSKPFHVFDGYAAGEVAAVAAMAGQTAKPPTTRRLTTQKASKIKPRPVQWVWDTSPLPTGSPQYIRQGRFPVGSLVLVVGRAGVGKSQLAAWFVARITTGTLPGAFYGQPSAVVYCATEDSWEMTIVPRLIAAGADLDRVYRVQVSTDGDGNASLTLPTDTKELEQIVTEHDVAMVVMDPLLSLLDAQVNDYRAREVREALEPLVAMADRTRVLLLGLAHFTKGSGSDPLLLVSGSAAFGQLVRAAVACARDDNAIITSPATQTDPSCAKSPHIYGTTGIAGTARSSAEVNGGSELCQPVAQLGPVYVLSQIKNNLGRDDLPSLTYQIEPYSVDTDDGPAWVSRLRFAGGASRSVQEILSSADVALDSQEQGDRTPAQDWLRAFLGDGEQPSVDVKREFKKAGFGSDRTLARARQDLGVEVTWRGQPPSTYWSLPVTPVVPQT